MVPETWLPMSFSPMKSKFPMKPAFPASPKASEYPNITQITVTMPMAKKFCMSMDSTCLARTMPA